MLTAINPPVAVTFAGTATIAYPWLTDMADSDSEFDMVSHFGAVDELIQLIYQGSDKFVLISAVNNVHWTLHLGLAGVGRWWKGQWTEKDIFKFLVR